MGALVWLASYPKSGNTWLRAFLHNLLRAPARPMNINEIDSFTLGDSQAAWYRALTDRAPDQLSPEELAELRPKAHRAMMKAHPDSVFVKTHSYLGENSGVPLITMDCTAGAIYVVRNPLDVVLSFADHFGLSIDKAMEAMARDNGVAAPTERNVSEFIGSWSMHVKSWTQRPNSQLLVLRYEDMLDTPFKAFGRTAKFLGLEPPRARLAKAIRFSSFKTLRSQEDAAGFKERSDKSRRFFRAGKKNQWKDKLTPEQVRAIIDRHREQMSRFGYIPEGY
ncbi:MAG: sulfotransferase domain-containing protein [Rhodospirillales bacterium]|nr:sulfotransferase domain-containing protein [Rhodospirillales bacterium]MDH3912218.1 sulfotransferase domain-containing protein [Rhodospirillales bacterium]MDH3918861.1 sulfotransferase domain-containing protein [Rhodospirillales bacterium]MDH3966497.1 sulfotransferase domain-containing protein [Rhodospirillales bacterium]